jgi:hypothetical protein
LALCLSSHGNELQGKGEEKYLEGVGGEMEEGIGGETWTGIGEKRKQLIGGGASVRGRGEWRLGFSTEGLVFIWGSEKI